MNLFAAEWSRLFSRRLTLVVIGLIATLLTLLALGFGATSSQPSPDEEALARQVAAQAAEAWERDVELCERVRSGLATAPPGQRLPDNCDYGSRPTVDRYLDYGFSFRRQWPELFSTAAIVLALAGFVIGASFVGAEWTSGGMTNLLLWRPDRVHVLAAKLGAVLAGMLAVSAACLAAWTGVFLAVAATTGTVGDMGVGEISSLLLAAVRVVLLALFGTALGFSIASIGKHTATATGVGIAYLLLYELGSFIVSGLVGVVSADRYRLSSYVIAWLNKKYRFGSDAYACGPDGCVEIDALEATWLHGGLVLAAVSAVAIGAAFVSIRRRDAG